MTVTFRDTAERLFWTFVAAFLSTLIASPVLVSLLEALSSAPTAIDISLLGFAAVSAATAGLIAVGNAVLLIARWRLSVLPTPGEGLPGLPIVETRRAG